MSLWDNVKKFAAPYSDDDYDDYDEDEEDTEDEYEEEEERPARRSAPARRPRAAAPVEDEPEEEGGQRFWFRLHFCVRFRRSGQQLRLQWPRAAHRLLCQ